MENPMKEIEMVMNGEVVRRSVNPKTSLLRFLRDVYVFSESGTIRPSS